MFNAPILDFVRQSVAMQVFGVIRGGRLNLGGSSGPNGGSGTPPGGFDGLLIQTAMAYDTTEAATLAGSDTLLDNLNHIRYQINNAGMWTRSGGLIYPTTITDFVGIGTAFPSVRLEVSGSQIINLPGCTDDLQFPLTLQASTGSAVPPTALGVGLQFLGNTDTTDDQLMGYIAAYWSDYVDASRKSYMRFYVVDSGGGLSNIAQLGVGNISLNDYTTVLDFESQAHVRLAGHILNTGGTPSLSTGSGAGTGATKSISGTDISGMITVTTGTLPVGGLEIVTATFDVPYGSAPYVMLSPRNAAVAALSGTSNAYIGDVTTTAFTIYAGSVPLSGSTEYKWTYSVSGKT